MRAARRRYRATLAVVIVALGPAAAAADQALDEARARWSSSGLGDYRYAYQKYCECHRDEPPQTFVIVESDRITRVFHLHADSDREVPAREGSLDLYWTVDGLFDLIAGAEDRGLTVRATYDASRGHPTSLFIDYDPAVLGEELDLRITLLEPLD